MGSIPPFLVQSLVPVIPVPKPDAQLVKNHDADKNRRRCPKDIYAGFINPHGSPAFLFGGMRLAILPCGDTVLTLHGAIVLIRAVGEREFLTSGALSDLGSEGPHFKQ